jgi:hypothetical protein
MERDLRDQLDRASTADSSSGAGAEWKRRFELLESDHEELKMELREQQQVMTQALYLSYPLLPIKWITCRTIIPGTQFRCISPKSC